MTDLSVVESEEAAASVSSETEELHIEAANPTMDCLDKDGIDSYVYLLAVGANLPLDNEFNQWTEEHLETCPACAALAQSAFNEAMRVYVQVGGQVGNSVPRLLANRLSGGGKFSVVHRRLMLHCLAEDPGLGDTLESTITTLATVAEKDGEKCVRELASDLRAEVLAVR